MKTLSDSVHVVTGGAGFIGSHIVRALVERGETVRIVDDFSSGKRENLADLAPGSFDLVEADIRNAEDLREPFRGAHYVYHQAALPSVQQSIADPVSTVETNVNGSLNVLLAAREAGVKKVVCASSSAIYGDGPELPKHEGLLPSPLSPYAMSKASGEMLTSIFAPLYGVEVIGLRYFNVFGPRQDPNSEYAAVVPKFITRMIDGSPPVIYGDGEQTRDFIYIDNIVNANLEAAKSDARGINVNAACGQHASLNQLVQLLNEILGTQFEPEYAEVRPGDIRDSQADITRAREAFGFNPAIDFKEGLRRTVEWHRAQRPR